MSWDALFDGSNAHELTSDMVKMAAYERANELNLLRDDLGTLKWTSAVDGDAWDSAIEAVRDHLERKCIEILSAHFPDERLAVEMSLKALERMKTERHNVELRGCGEQEDGQSAAHVPNDMENYILDGHKAVVCSDILTWAKWFEANNKNRHVADEKIGDVRVSTVFLGLDHSFGDGPPLLFETMIFGGPLDQEQDRCTTWDEAERMHAVMVERVKHEGSNV